MEKIGVMSPEWAEGYKQLWNANSDTRDGTRDLDMLIEMRLDEPEPRAVQIDVKAGEAVYGGAPLPDRKPDFVLTAKRENWKRVATGDINPVTAITVRKIHFVGPLRVAMSHMPALTTGLRLVGDVPGLDWEI
ncbi:MAG: SCP2 sterol-binding domain-containing protein [Actinomycetota bacterium]|jgi:putative sterol carrier protein